MAKNKTNKKGNKKEGDINVENMDDLLLSGIEENTGDTQTDASEENIVVDFDGNQLPEATLNVAEAVKEVETDNKKDKKEKKEKNDSSQKTEDNKKKASEKTEEKVSSEEIEISPEQVRMIVDKITGEMGISEEIPAIKLSTEQKDKFTELFSDKLSHTDLSDRDKQIMRHVMNRLIDTNIISYTANLVTQTSESFVELVKKDMEPEFAPLLDGVKFNPAVAMDSIIDAMLCHLNKLEPEEVEVVQERFLNKIGFTNKRVGKFIEGNPEKKESILKFLNVIADMSMFAVDPVEVVNSITRNMCKDGFPTEFIFATKVGL